MLPVDIFTTDSLSSLLDSGMNKNLNWRLICGNIAKPQTALFFGITATNEAFPKNK